MTSNRPADATTMTVVQHGRSCEEMSSVACPCVLADLDIVRVRWCLGFEQLLDALVRAEVGRLMNGHECGDLGLQALHELLILSELRLLLCLLAIREIIHRAQRLADGAGGR
jgi:hypothetical protein